MSNLELGRLRAGFIDREEVANLLGISDLYLGKLERGDKKTSPKLIVRMAKLYRCTTDEIFKDFNITG